MSDIIIALGDKDNVFEDISILAKKVSENPEVIISTGKEIKNHIIEKSSALFIEQNIVMAFVDPSDEIIPVSYTHLRAHETPEHLVSRPLLEKKQTHKHPSQ